MSDYSLILTVVVLAVVMGFFISGRARVDLIAICTLAALLIFGLLKPEQALSGFTNPATATIAAMFVLSAGLVRTGMLQWVARHIDVVAGRGEWRLILVLCLVAAVLSAFLVNTAVVAIFIPVAVMLANDRKISPSKVLIPLSFASQFGGVCTIIGTSTNMLVNGIAISKDIRAFGFFELAPLGLVMVAVGTLYLLFIGRRLLPKRKGIIEQVDKNLSADYHAELMVLGDSQMAGKTWEKCKIGKETGLKLTNLIREGSAVSRPAKTVVRPGDLLLVNGNIEKIMGAGSKFCLDIVKSSRSKIEKPATTAHEIVEAVLPPNSNLLGKTLQGSDFFRRYNATVIALQRRGKSIKERLGDIELEGGDTLLIQAHRDDITRLMNSDNTIITSKRTELHLRREKAFIALGVMGITVALAVFNVFPIMVAAIIGALAMIVTRCITIQEAYDAIDWKIIFLLGGIIPLGIALEQNGVIMWLADNVLSPFSSFGPVMLLSALYLVTAVLTESMSNNAAAAILAPVAIVLAQSLNVDPRPFLIAITFAASTSFATPIGYQTNTMVYMPGGYRFIDYVKVGVPLNIIFWILATLLIPVIWPF
jgi:di/tricarboxylate transporter